MGVPGAVHAPPQHAEALDCVRALEAPMKQLLAHESGWQYRDGVRLKLRERLDKNPGWQDRVLRRSTFRLYNRWVLAWATTR